MMGSNQLYYDLVEKIDKLEKKIVSLEQNNESLKNKLIYRDKELYDTLYNLNNDNFSTVALSADKYIRVGKEGYRAGIEGANSADDIVFWAGQSKPSTDCPYYVLADGTLHATNAILGTNGTNADDMIDNTYFEAWVSGNSDYGTAAQLQSSGGNLLLNNPTYYLYAANDLGQGFYVKKDGSAYISSGVTIGAGGSVIASESYAFGVADDAYDDATSYADNYADGTYSMIGAKLKSTDGNLVINSTVSGTLYYLYAVKNGKGFYIDTSGNALFTGDITGSKLYGLGTNSAYIMVGNTGSNADLSVYKNSGTYPTFRVYDGSTFIALQAGTNAAIAPSTFLELTNTTAIPQGTWDFQDCTVTNLYAKYA
ncbi:MAG TPA: hypothetical protein VEF53_18935 [Patescibacteria group bacterium]|nr:hypothetical protein [Patescibacteria group bacterium]